MLWGEGEATNFRATGTVQYDLINIVGTAGKTEISSTMKQITDTFVPVGTKIITVEAGHNFVKGDWVHVRRTPNQDWIHLLGMDILSTISSTASNWKISDYTISSERKIMNVQGNVLTLDAPIMDVIDPLYAQGFVTKFNSARIQNCAVENMKISSTYTSDIDENHGWTAIVIDKAENCWVKKVIAYDFGFGCVDVNSEGAFVTVDSCSMLDPKSIITGGRRYPFNLDGQRNLVKNCTTRKGRHDYATGAFVAGPNVFYNSTATVEYADNGPHHRWATGILFDNIITDGEINVQDRQASGTGHGWAGSQIMFWNCEANKIIVQDPPSYHRNWAIGCIGGITNIGLYVTRPYGIVESYGVRVDAIPSLFIAQLNDRLKLLSTYIKPISATQHTLQILPNPATSVINLKYEGSESPKVQIDIFTLEGKKVLTITKTANQSTNGNNLNLNISELNKGIYLLKLITGVTVYSAKLIVCN